MKDRDIFTPRPLPINLPGFGGWAEQITQTGNALGVAASVLDKAGVVINVHDVAGDKAPKPWEVGATLLIGNHDTGPEGFIMAAKYGHGTQIMRVFGKPMSLQARGLMNVANLISDQELSDRVADTVLPIVSARSGKGSAPWYNVRKRLDRDYVLWPLAMGWPRPTVEQIEAHNAQMFEQEAPRALCSGESLVILSTEVGSTKWRPGVGQIVAAIDKDRANEIMAVNFRVEPFSLRALAKAVFAGKSMPKPINITLGRRQTVAEVLDKTPTPINPSSITDYLKSLYLKDFGKV